ncbi:tetratricopeptide repeat protein [Ruegeria meonggei]|uniref:Tetratricopeptide repeat protein n=1 Tax=Ruegeria meonggei TaxID=1446476 RepID=A0A1X6YHW0_9RHOB|nr:tetratricopeptide repeat protein [Ruegeria meonggei]SLN21772.1 Tetratricopeptide repeat protein [Ruegeria meonggei]
MIRFAAFSLMIAVTAAPAAAHSLDGKSCAEVVDHAADVDVLIAQIQDAETEQEARVISGQMWQLWTDAPDWQAQALLDRGMQRLKAGELAEALNILDALVIYCPDYAEGYNQRAFVNYLQHDFEAALPDLDRAIELSPNHVAAISGRALTLLGLERLDEARTALSQALELNPWLSERHLLGPGGPLEPLGKDI